MNMRCNRSMRTAAAQQRGAFDDEIVPLATTMKVQDRETKEISDVKITLEKDEGNRPSTNLERLQTLQPVFKDGQTISQGKFITAGNASQLSDGASAAVVMEAREAAGRGIASARDLSRHGGGGLWPR